MRDFQYFRKTINELTLIFTRVITNILRKNALVTFTFVVDHFYIILTLTLIYETRTFLNYIVYLFTLLITLSCSGFLLDRPVDCRVRDRYAK